MRLFEDTLHWMRVNDGDERAYRLFKRHYTYRERDGRLKNAKKFVGPGESVVLIKADDRGGADALFVWRRQVYVKNDQHGVNCSIFRNESQIKSSVLLHQAEQIAKGLWPGERLFTYVNPKKVLSKNPGYCFKVNGWRVCGTTKKRKLLILEKI